MSDTKHDGYVGPNDPAYYAPRELRERAASGQPDPDALLKQAAEWRPRLTTDDPPLQPLGRPQRRETSEVFTKAVAQALQEAMESAPVEAPSVLRDNSGRRALFNLAVRFSLAVAIAASIASILVMAIPASQRPAAQPNDASSISAAWQSVKSALQPAPQEKQAATLSAPDDSGLASETPRRGIQVAAPPPGAVVASPPPAPVAAVAAPAVPVAAAPVVAAPPPQAEIVRNLDPKEISGLVTRGQDLLASGDIQSARLLLLRGAEARDARSAFLLGTTYDPALLKQLGANGPLADPAQARNWYRKAREWGEPDAQRRLEALALPR